MALRFKFFLALVFLSAAPYVFGSNAPQTDQSGDALEMVAKRMRSLTNSLEHMPKPPAFDQKIQLPADFLPSSKSSNPSHDDVYLEKENEA